MEGSEMADSIVPHRAAGQRSLAWQLTLFGGKTLIVAVVFVASILVIAVHLEHKAAEFAQQLQKGTKVGGSEFWKKVEQEIDRAGDPGQAISPEKKQKILSELRAITAEWKPFMTEAYSIVTETPSQPAPTASSGK
jgi:hypothetical protein